MGADMKRALTAIISGAGCLPVLAQMSPVGLWRNVDDKTGEAKAEIRIVLLEYTRACGSLRVVASPLRGDAGGPDQ